MANPIIVALDFKSISKITSKIMTTIFSKLKILNLSKWINISITMAVNIICDIEFFDAYAYWRDVISNPTEKYSTYIEKATIATDITYDIETIFKSLSENCSPTKVPKQ